jgi:hypothetical protein
MDILVTRACSALHAMAAAVFFGAALAAAGTGSGAMVALPLALGFVLLTLIVDARDPAIHPDLRHRIELAASGLLAISPWLFGFAEDVWRPHLHAGQLGIGVTILVRQLCEHRAAAPDWAAALARRPAAPGP